jgi:hypothetical protein
MTGIGTNRIITSPKIENAAFAYQKAVVLMQVPGIALFQDRGIGVHWKIEPPSVAMP